MADDLDSIVKGASAATPMAIKSTTPISPVAGKPSDPLSNTPSSPSMIYLNLLILEASLRAQFLELRARRRHHTFFITLLGLWVSFFGYKLYFSPREDGQGVGGSIYWAVEGTQKVCFMGGIITALLLWATGIWERGMRWPRRWFAVSNRGLRPFNCKLVVIRQPWWAEALLTAGFFLTYGLFSHTASSSYRHVEPHLLREVEKELALTADSHPMLVLPGDDFKHGHEEDLAPGGDYVKLLLLAKPFSPTFRENWELYRTEYWERENERRALLRDKAYAYEKKLAKQQFGWFWWLPWKRVQHKRVAPAPKRPHSSHEKDHRRRTSTARRSSVSSARSFTPSLDVDDGVPSSRRTGSISSISDKRRRKPAGSLSKATKKPQGSDSRSVTPELLPSPLARDSGTKRDSVPPSPDGGRVLRSSGDGSRAGTPNRESKSSLSE